MPDSRPAAVDPVPKGYAVEHGAKEPNCRARGARIAGIVVLTCCLALAGAAAASEEDCNSDDPARMISGCTDVLETGLKHPMQTLPTRTIALMRRGAAHKERQEFKEAIGDFSQAFKLSPRMASLFVLRGQTYALTRELGHAESDLYAALSLEPHNADALAAIRTLPSVTGGPPGPAGGPQPASHAWLGLTIQQVSPGIAWGLGVEQPRGALIVAIEPGGPAAKAQLKPGDLVLAFEGKRIGQYEDLRKFSAETPPDKTVTLSVWRDRQEFQIPAKAAAEDPNRIPPPVDVGNLCTYDHGEWYAEREWHQRLIITRGFTCLSNLAYTDVPPIKFAVSKPSKGKVNVCGPLCFAYRPDEVGEDQFVVTLCKATEANCDQVPKANAVRLIYEVQIVEPLFSHARLPQPTVSGH
jgi:tetratricopeptide (TPR) repeat protein